MFPVIYFCVKTIFDLIDCAISANFGPFLGLFLSNVLVLVITEIIVFFINSKQTNKENKE
jgi:hypothetical protein